MFRPPPIGCSLVSLKKANSVELQRRGGSPPPQRKFQTRRRSATPPSNHFLKPHMEKNKSKKIGLRQRLEPRSPQAAPKNGASQREGAGGRCLAKKERPSRQREAQLARQAEGLERAAESAPTAGRGGLCPPPLSHSTHTCRKKSRERFNPTAYVQQKLTIAESFADLFTGAQKEVGVGWGKGA